jgi:hypothetical protein
VAWSTDRMFRGATNLAFDRLARDLGFGPPTEILALALAHACYPQAKYGDNGIRDEVVQRLKEFEPRPCDKNIAIMNFSEWEAMGRLSTADVFRNVWGMPADQFFVQFLSMFESNSQPTPVEPCDVSDARLVLEPDSLQQLRGRTSFRVERAEEFEDLGASLVNAQRRSRPSRSGDNHRRPACPRASAGRSDRGSRRSRSRDGRRRCGGSRSSPPTSRPG